MPSELIIHTDGGSRGNPGPAATGIVVLQNNQEIHAFGKFLGVATNNDAEYAAVIDALEWVITTYPDSPPQLTFN
jgi:ribonuclease HI